MKLYLGMPLPLHLHITTAAQQGRLEITLYLKHQFSKTVAVAYVHALTDVFQMLAHMPELGTVWKGVIRKFVCQKHTLIFYRFTQSDLYILEVVDARTNYLAKFL